MRSWEEIQQLKEKRRGQKFLHMLKTRPQGLMTFSEPTGRFCPKCGCNVPKSAKKRYGVYWCQRHGPIGTPNYDI